MSDKSFSGNLKMKELFLLVATILLTVSCAQNEQSEKLARYVDPFIGTQGPGNVIPGALRPHSLVKLSPDNVGSPLGGYEYDVPYITGFSHTHLQGTGGGAYGNILFYPMTGSLEKILKGKCFSGFSHEKESASPGYYMVELLDSDVKAELTTTEHAGFHRYTFHNAGISTILVDVGHSLGQACSDGFVEIVGDRVVKGYGYYGYPVYFYAEFDKPFSSFGTWSGGDLVRPYQVIPSEYLFVDDGSGRHGLKGEYYNNKTLSGKPVYTRIDTVVGFRWGMNHPEKLPLNGFSIRWTGKLVPPVTGKYKIRLDGDDGIRFWLDGKLLIDQWVNRGETADIVEVDLKGGKAVDLKIEYYENVGVSLARLKWDLVPEKGEIHKNSRKEEGPAVGAFVRYETEAGGKVHVKVGISHVSLEQAVENLRSEMSGMDFDAVQKQSVEIWNETLNRLKVKGGTHEQKVKFYTSVYHSLIVPTDYTEGDTFFCGLTGKAYPSEGRSFYGDDWCTWDTYRTTHPLQILMEPEKQSDYARSYVQMYEHSGCLPNCPGNWADCGANMDGNHTIAVLADIYSKGFRDFDAEKAYEAIRKNSMENPGGDKELSEDYLKLGYIPFAYDGGVREKKSASLTLNRVYDDWCAGQMAKALGKEEDYRMFSKRAQNYRHLFDKETGFMRPRMRDGSWKEPFNPASKQGNSNGFTESNSWQMTFSVPHDIQGLIELMGGREAFVKKLDEYFAKGLHNPGNEPDFINPFLFNYAGAPWKTQEVVRNILADAYGADPAGLKGNDDSGAMSAWYSLAAAGLYPVCPGSNIYVLTSPVFTEVTIAPGNGKEFCIVAENSSDVNKYIQSAELNGKPWNKPWIRYDDIAKGGRLVLKMGNIPNRDWGSEPEDAPPAEL